MVKVPMRITPPGRCPWPRPLTAPHSPEWRSVDHLTWMPASLPNQPPNSTLLNPYAHLWVKGTICTVPHQFQVGTNLIWCPNLVVWEWDWSLLYCYCNFCDECIEPWSNNETIQFAMFGKGSEYEADSLCFWFCIRIYSTIEVFVQSLHRIS